MKVDLSLKILACLMLTHLVGCRDKGKDGSTPPPITRHPDGAPMAMPFFDPLGEVKVGSLKLFMPVSFGTGVWPLRIYETFDYTVGTVLENDSIKSPALVRTRIIKKACDPTKETEEFVQEGLSLISQGTEAIAVRDWSSESEVFKGKSFYRTQHGTSGEIPNYRIAILLANEKVPECIIWNIEIKPDQPISSSFVEGSNEFIVLQKGFAKTWDGIGALFRNE